MAVRVRRWRRWVVVLAAAAAVAVNLAAYLAARALTRFERPRNRATPADLRLPFAAHTIPGAGGALEAWHLPAEGTSRGLALVFHGHAACKSFLLTEAAAFRELGWDVVMVDFRASGGSAGDVCTIGVREADDVTAAVAFARERWPGRPLVLFGQSMGAAAVLRAVALGGVTADALVLECPFDRMLTTVEHRFHVLGLPGFPMARLMLFWGGVQLGLDAFAHNPVEYAAGVRRPALL